jgi:hypothetical protein
MMSLDAVASLISARLAFAPREGGGRLLLASSTNLMILDRYSSGAERY